MFLDAHRRRTEPDTTRRQTSPTPDATPLSLPARIPLRHHTPTPFAVIHAPRFFARCPPGLLNRRRCFCPPPSPPMPREMRSGDRAFAAAQKEWQPPPPYDAATALSACHASRPPVERRHTSAAQRGTHAPLRLQPRHACAKKKTRRSVFQPLIHIQIFIFRFSFQFCCWLSPYRHICPFFPDVFTRLHVTISTECA